MAKPCYLIDMMKRNFFIVFLLLIGLSVEATAQRREHIMFNVGADVSTNFYMGFDYRPGDFSLGVDIGTSLGAIKPFDFYAFNFETQYYFGRHSFYGLRTWYLSNRLLYTGIRESFSNKPRYMLYVSGLGKEFNLNDHFALNCTAGVDVLLWSTDEGAYISPSARYYERVHKVLPHLRFEVIYRF